MGDVTVNIDLMDSEILKVERVLNVLNEKQQRYVDLEAFRKEIIERFGLIGFKVAVRVYTTNVEQAYAFDVDIVERLAGEFDPDQQVHEVTNDLLDLGEGGVIPSGEILKQAESGHTHSGHGHHH
jgi:hypothetical protein